MLSKVLPRLIFDEMLEFTKKYNIAGLLGKVALIYQRPFRNPPHATSLVRLLEKGSNPHPRKIILGHRNVLLLDEFPEFPHNVKNLLQSIEDTIASSSRTKGKITFPKKCMLTISQNSYPCGYLGDKSHNCICPPVQILRYKKKNWSSLFDRIDIHPDVFAVKDEKLTAQDSNNVENLKTVKERVQKAPNKQHKRYQEISLTANAELTINFYCKLFENYIQLLRQAVFTANLSEKAYYQIIKLFRTIADLAYEKNTQPTHIAEALQYRPKLQDY